MNDSIANEVGENPCSMKIYTASSDLQKCCNALNAMYHHGNIEKIMELLKYSLDLSKPWISKYYRRSLQNGNRNQEATADRDLDKIWMAKMGLGNLDMGANFDEKYLPTIQGYVIVPFKVQFHRIEL